MDNLVLIPKGICSCEGYQRGKSSAYEATVSGSRPIHCATLQYMGFRFRGYFTELYIPTMTLQTLFGKRYIHGCVHVHTHTQTFTITHLRATQVLNGA